jgi:hypothetical protein
MKKIYKIVNIALIFMLIIGVVCQDIAMASDILRVPMGINPSRGSEASKSIDSSVNVVPTHPVKMPKYLIREAVIQSAFSNIKLWIENPKTSSRDMIILCIWIIKTMSPDDSRLAEIDNSIKTKILEMIELHKKTQDSRVGKRIADLKDVQRLSIRDIFTVPSDELSVSQLARLLDYDTVNLDMVKRSMGVLIRFFELTQNGYLFPEKLKCVNEFRGSPDRKLQWFSSVILSFIDRDIKVMDDKLDPDYIKRSRVKYVTKEIISEELEITEGNTIKAGRNLWLSDWQIYNLIKRFDINVGKIAEAMELKRKQYVLGRAQDVLSSKKKDGWWDMPIPQDFSPESIPQIIEKLDVGNKAKSRNDVCVILRKYADYVMRMRDLGVRTNCCAYGDVVSCIINEAMVLIKTRSERRLTYLEIAKILGISYGEVSYYLIKIRKIIEKDLHESPFLGYAIMKYKHQRRPFERIRPEDIGNFLDYAKINTSTKQLIVTKDMLESYVAHVNLMKKIDIVKSRDACEDFIIEFIKLAKNKMNTGDDSPVRITDIVAAIGYSDRTVFYDAIEQKLKAKIEGGWTDIFAVNKREDGVFKKAFLELKKSALDNHNGSVKRNAIIMTLKSMKGNPKAARNILGMGEKKFRTMLKRYDINPKEIQENSRLQRTYYLTEKSEIINAGKKSGDRWDIPIPDNFSESSMSQVLVHLIDRGSAKIPGRQDISVILREYMKYISIMNGAGVTKNSTFYGDVIGCLVTEALILAKKGSQHKVNYVETAKLLGIPVITVLDCVKTIRKRILRDKSINAFLACDDTRSMHKGRPFEMIEESKVGKFLSYISIGKKIEKPFISRYMLESYLRHARFMEAMGIKETRNRYEDFIVVFLECVKNAIYEGNKKPFDIKYVVKKMGYSNVNMVRSSYLDILRELDKRIEEGWTDIFAVDKREDEVFKEAFLRTQKSGYSVKQILKNKRINGVSI